MIDNFSVDQDLTVETRSTIIDQDLIVEVVNQDLIVETRGIITDQDLTVMKRNINTQGLIVVIKGIGTNTNISTNMYKIEQS